MLVVGKGAKVSGSYGGGSGMVAYKKNMEIIPGTFSAISVNFTNDTLVWLLAEVGASASNYIQAGNGNLGDGATAVQYWLNGSSAVDQLDGYGSNGGGGYIRTSGTVVGYAGGGSNGDADGDIPGVGGDGKFGYKGGGSNAGIGITKGTIIPLTSIFSGTGKGGRSSVSLAGGGAGGYGDGNIEVTGYGNGLAAGASYTQSQGIVCLYYHNDPIE